MRDVIVIYPLDSEDTSWNLDIDIVDGYPRYVPEEQNTQDQRASLAALQAKGTIPGMPERGINWGELLDNKETIIQVDNEIKAAIDENAGNEGVKQYLPIYNEDENGRVSVEVVKV